MPLSMRMPSSLDIRITPCEQYSSTALKMIWQICGLKTYLHPAITLWIDFTYAATILAPLMQYPSVTSF